MQNFPFDKQLLLENKEVRLEVRLEPLEEKHFDLLLPISLQEPDLIKYSPSPFGSENLLKKILKLLFHNGRRKKRYPFTIYYKLLKKYEGITSMGEISSKDLRLPIGWTWIGKEFQGTGLNKDCKYLMLSYIFEILEFERVEF